MSLSDQVKEQTPQTEDISSCSKMLAIQYFWSHIARSPTFQNDGIRVVSFAC